MREEKGVLGGKKGEAKKLASSTTPKSSAPSGSGKKPPGKLMVAFTPRLRELRFSLYLMSKSFTSIAGIVLIIALIVLAAFPGLFAAPAPNSTNPFEIPKDFTKPIPVAPGTDGFALGSGQNGVSISYGIIWGARISMSFAIQVVGLSVIIGLLIGLVSGYKGGAIDELMMRITDVFLSIPSLILVMAIAAVLGRGIFATKIALLAVWWAGYTRLVRGQVLSIRENSYIDAARASGAGELRIMFRHILPNSWAPMIVQATMDMGTVVLVLAGLSYLGLGAPIGYAEWGVMVQQGQQFFVQGFWWMTVFPGIAILIFVLGFNLMGDGLRDVMDPKMRR